MLVEAFAVHGLSVDAAGVRSTGDKGTRANSLASTTGEGGVWLVAGVWNEPYLAELHAFPDGTHDDRVDASAGAFNAVTELDGAAGLSAVNEPAKEVAPRRRVVSRTGFSHLEIKTAGLVLRDGVVGEMWRTG